MDSSTLFLDRMHILQTTLPPLKRSKIFEPSTNNEVWCPRMWRNTEQISDIIECTAWPSCVPDSHSLPLGVSDAQPRPIQKRMNFLNRVRTRRLKTIHNQCLPTFEMVCRVLFPVHILEAGFSKRSGCIGCIRVSSIAGRNSACADRSCCRGLWMHLGYWFWNRFSPKSVCDLTKAVWKRRLKWSCDCY